MTRTISNSDNVIDSRDVIARIEELRDEIGAAAISEENGTEPQLDDNGKTVVRMATCGECGKSWNDALITSRTPAPSARCPYEHIHDEIAELKYLEALAEEAERSPDWQYGETLIRESYFENYAQELAEDCAPFSVLNSWPYRCIDWEQAARELRMDYFTVDFDGVTYLIRA